MCFKGGAGDSDSEGAAADATQQFQNVAAAVTGVYKIISAALLESQHE